MKGVCGLGKLHLFLAKITYHNLHTLQPIPEFFRWIMGEKMVFKNSTV